MTQAPVGEVTFLFTDIEGSTTMWEQSTTTMVEALAEHDRTVRAIVEAHRGFVFTTAGDSFSVAFASASGALAAAIEIQRAMREPVGGLNLRVRVGIHTGIASMRDDDYFGPPLNRCARITTAAHGGQVLLSQSTFTLVDGQLPEQAELIDLGLHRLRDLAEPERIHQLCHPDLASSFPKLRSLEGPGDALPGQLTSFIGRSQEIADVTALIGEHRLVTLSGAGGAGKTRLALQVAEDLGGTFPDGLRFAELAALFDNDVFVNEIAERFGATPETDVPLVATVATKIGERRMLLILDNCEQIVGHVASLGRDLLLACPNLHIIATSRERLAISGEVVYRVPSLSVPVAQVDPTTGMEFDAVRLFVDRAQLADPTFELTSDNVVEVVAICRHLDGIPLAIELAAARLRSMSPTQISDRLDERFRILTGSERSGNQRQQTLLRTIEWSHDLLDDRERIVFRRLGVFVSDFSLEAAEQVAAGGPIEDVDVLELLTGLVDKSMITTETGIGTTTRYQLLESIREFARRRLDDASEHHDVDRGHAHYFADFAESLQAMYRRGDLSHALMLLGKEEDNVRASLRFTLGSDHQVLAGRLVSALGYLWYAAGTHREGAQWCSEFFDSRPDLPDAVRAGALHSYGTMLGVTGRPAQGIEVFREEISLREDLGDPVRLGAALNNMGNLMVDVGDYDGAEPVLYAAIDAFREAGENPSLILSSLATGALQQGRYDECELLCRDALQESRVVDDRYGIAVAMGALGKCLALMCRFDEARVELDEARDRFEELNVTPGVADVDISLALVERADGSRVESARRLHTALTSSGKTWDDDADYWIAQLTASIIDDLPTAALLIGAAASHYERSGVAQAMWVVRDHEHTAQMLQQTPRADDLGRSHRAGTRRTRPEVLHVTTGALESFIEHVTAGSADERPHRGN